MAYTQESRLISLTTPLGEDKLLLHGFSGHGAISRLFGFHLDLLAEQGPIEFSQIIGKAGTGCGSRPTSPTDPDQADDGSKGGKMN
jgi:uncharacterized protein involved in type VI secretion and phage assembly